MGGAEKDLLGLIVTAIFIAECIVRFLNKKESSSKSKQINPSGANKDKDITADQIKYALEARSHKRASFLLNHITHPLIVRTKWIVLSELLGYKSAEEDKSKLITLFFTQFPHLDVSFERTSYLFGKTAAVNIFKFNLDPERD